MKHQIDLARSRAITGMSVYSFSLVDAIPNAWAQLAAGPFRYPATIPAMGGSEVGRGTCDVKRPTSNVERHLHGGASPFFRLRSGFSRNSVQVRPIVCTTSAPIFSAS